VKEKTMADTIMAVLTSPDLGLASSLLLTFALVMLWFKRRTLAVKLPNISGDFLNRHVETVDRNYPRVG